MIEDSILNTFTYIERFVVYRINEHVDVIIKVLYCFLVEHNWFCQLSLTGKFKYYLNCLKNSVLVYTRDYKLLRKGY